MKTACCTLLLTFLYYLNFVESSSSDDSFKSARSRSLSRSHSSASSVSSSASSSLQQNQAPLSRSQLKLLQDVINEPPQRGFPNLFPMQGDVYLPIPPPNPPYRVYLMAKNLLNNVEIMYGTRSVRGNEISVEYHTYYPVRHALYIVEHDRRIIGYAQPDGELMPFKSSLLTGEDKFAAINLRTSRRRHQIIDKQECDALGIFQKLPSNTEFDVQPQSYPKITIIKVGDRVVGAFTDGVFKYDE